MESIKNVFHVVTGVTFVVGLYTVSNDNSVLKLIIIDENTKLCYLDVVNLGLKKFYVNVIIF